MCGWTPPYRGSTTTTTQISRSRQWTRHQNLDKIKNRRSGDGTLSPIAGGLSGGVVVCTGRWAIYENQERAEVDAYPAS